MNCTLVEMTQTGDSLEEQTGVPPPLKSTSTFKYSPRLDVYGVSVSCWPVTRTTYCLLERRRRQQRQHGDLLGCTSSVHIRPHYGSCHLLESLPSEKTRYVVSQAYVHNSFHTIPLTASFNLGGLYMIVTNTPPSTSYSTIGLSC